MSLAMRDRLGLVGERDQAGDRSEDLLLRDAHAVVDVGKDRRHARSCPCAAAPATPAHPGRRTAASRLPCGRARCSCAPWPGGLADHRADDGLLVQRVADRDALGALGEACRRSRHRSTFCTRMRQPAVQRSPLLEKIMNTAASSARSRSASSKTTNGDLAAQLHAELLQPGALHDAVAGGACEPVNEIARTSGCAHQRLAGVVAVAVHDVQHARRDAGFQRQLAQPRRGQRRQLAHLQHRGVAERQAGRDLPGARS